MTDILSDERLAEIREDAETCSQIGCRFDWDAHEVLSLLARLDKAEEAKDGAYAERNQCVGLIAKFALAAGYKVGIAKTAIEGWSEDWHGCVYIELPTGQVSWHYHDSDAALFSSLPAYDGVWDGHSTPEKYERVNTAEFIVSHAEKKPVEDERAACAMLADAQILEWPAGAWGVSPNAPYVDGRREGAVHIATAIRARSTIRETPAPAGWKLVQIEPTEELLRSMAVRYDHGLGVPGYYDQPIFGAENIGHEKRLRSTMTTMRQLHEEVVGTGFYREPPVGSGPNLADAT